jgi:hypothetical protein
LTAESGSDRTLGELIQPLDGGHHLKYVDQLAALRGQAERFEPAPAGYEVLIGADESQRQSLFSQEHHLFRHLFGVFLLLTADDDHGQ